MHVVPHTLMNHPLDKYIGKSVQLRDLIGQAAEERLFAARGLLTGQQNLAGGSKLPYL